jgi:hypothetical protein
MKTDITMHSDEELSLIVFNDETLYNMRYRLKNLLYHVDEMYSYNQDQLDVLIQDIDEDLAELD